MRAADVDKLKGEIADLKAAIQTPSWDYVTGYISALSAVEDMISTFPTLALGDLRPKGRWNIVEIDKATNRITIECTECGMVEEVAFTTYGLWRDFCPCCGADLRGGGEDD